MEAPTTSRYGALTKFAQGGVPPNSQTLVRKESSKYMVDLILAALGAGVVGRGVVGAGRFFGRGKPSPKPSPYAQNIELAVPQADEEEKLAADDQGGFDSGLRGSAAKFLYENLLKGKGWFQGGDFATTPFQIPAVVGLGVPAAVAAAAGGYYGADKILDWRRKAERKEDLGALKEEYDQIVAEGLSKQSEDAMLDGVATTVLDDLEKQAVDEVPAPPEWSKGVGGAAQSGIAQAGGWLTAYAALMAALSGKMSYDFFKKRNEKSVTEEAMRRRARQRTGGMMPANITTVPIEAP